MQRSGVIIMSRMMRVGLASAFFLFLTPAVVQGQVQQTPVRNAFELVKVNGQTLPAQLQMPHPQLDVEMTVMEGHFYFNQDGTYQQVLQQKVVVRDPRTDSTQTLRTEGVIEGTYQWDSPVIPLQLSAVLAKKLGERGQEIAVNRVSLSGSDQARHVDDRLLTTTPQQLQQQMGAPALELLFQKTTVQQPPSLPQGAKP